MRKEISRGAESVIYLDNNKIIKDRIRKNYRIPELDNKIRSTRTRSEAKLLEKLKRKGFLVPGLIDVTDERIVMEHIPGPRVRDILNAANYKKICREIGNIVRRLHNEGVIHGDLTTSNVLYFDKKIYFIDFGLSYQSFKVEDKAVDLHLLRQALESKHYKIWNEGFKQVLLGYADKEVIARLELVEQRGRNKAKY